MSRQVYHGPKPDLTHAERVARLEALVGHIGRELSLIIPGEWQVTLDFPAKCPPADEQQN